jgi:hypothetical protein
MKKLNLEILINASPEEVWDTIVNIAKYRKWTRVFQESSYFKGSWNKGDAIRFIAINDKGKEEGMVSEIAESSFPKFISIRHLGYMIDGVEDTTSDEIKKWAPSYENYIFEKSGDNTVFKLDMDVMDEHFDLFLALWPKALEKIKQVSEAL